MSKNKKAAHANNIAPICHNPASLALLKQLSHLKPVKPLPSRQFRVNEIFKCLREHFKHCWDHDKSKSAKLTFYHSTKVVFKKEPYIDVINNPSHRYRTTRLRISAHDLEIESGRYSKIPRESRVCKWCLLTFNENKIETENHMLFQCDLYADIRNNMIKLNILNKAPFPHEHKQTASAHAFNSINVSSLQVNFTNLLSPYSTTDINENDPHSIHHNFSTKTNTTYHTDINHASRSKLRSYIINTVAAFIGRAFDKRWAFIKELKESQSNSNDKPINA